MDAKELTKELSKILHRVDELEKTVSFQDQEIQKLQLKVNDMEYDLMDLQRQRR